MKYHSIVHASFIKRLNRFEATVLLEGQEVLVHVKNTGRCREILVEGANCILEPAANPKRKTAYDLVAAYKKDFGLINIDSIAPNKVAGEWLQTQGFDYIKPEYSYGDSRIDFYMEKRKQSNDYAEETYPGKGIARQSDTLSQDLLDNPVEKYLMEVKGCTLERDGIGYFPDAPTERGIKHLHELIKAKEMGYHTALAFVIPMEGVTEVRPNMETHPAFGTALQEAQDAGVKVLFLPCKVGEDEVTVLNPKDSY